MEGAPAFEQQLEENLRSDERITQFKDMNISDVVRSHFDLGDKLKAAEGAREGMVKMIGDDSTPEAKAEFYKATGKPDSPDAYEFDEPTLPDGMVRDDNLLSSFRNIAHEANLNPAQAKLIQAKYNEIQINQHKEVQKILKENHDKSVTELRKGWPGDKFDVNSELALRAVKTLGGEEFQTFLKDVGLDNNPMMVKTFHNIATKIGEDSLVPGTPSKGSTERPTSQLTGTTMLSFPSMEKT